MRFMTQCSPVGSQTSTRCQAVTRRGH
uniref:Uncharacterized protein n=1 Tax=Anguilla anguilla TaxID=7936 RepID=A0A0E9RX57_ANGAN